jgi:hypothetical protein
MNFVGSCQWTNYTSLQARMMCLSKWKNKRLSLGGSTSRKDYSKSFGNMGGSTNLIFPSGKKVWFDQKTKTLKPELEEEYMKYSLIYLKLPGLQARVADDAGKACRRSFVRRGIHRHNPCYAEVPPRTSRRRD